MVKLKNYNNNEVNSALKLGPVLKGTSLTSLCHPDKLMQFRVYLRMRVYTYVFKIPV